MNSEEMEAKIVSYAESVKVRGGSSSEAAGLMTCVLEEAIGGAKKAATEGDYFLTTAYIQAIQELSSTLAPIASLLALSTPLEGRSPIDAMDQARKQVNDAVGGALLAKIESYL